jgi:hypothetical protein
VAGCCERGNEPSGAMKCGEFLHQVRNRRFFFLMDITVWSGTACECCHEDVWRRGGDAFVTSAQKVSRWWPLQSDAVLLVKCVWIRCITDICVSTYSGQGTDRTTEGPWFNS